MDLKTVIHSEVRRRRTDTIYYGIYVKSKKNWWSRSYFLSRNRDIDMENKCMEMRKRGVDEVGDWDWHVYTVNLLRKKWQPTRVFLPGKSHWQRSPAHGIAKSWSWLSIHALLYTYSWYTLQWILTHCKVIILW